MCSGIDKETQPPRHQTPRPDFLRAFVSCGKIYAIDRHLRHLENRNLELRGELPLAELDLGLRDEMIRATQPLHYDLEIEMLDDSLLIQGSLQLTLECQCVRCLKDFKFELELDPWCSICRWSRWKTRKPCPSRTIAWT